MNKLKIAIAQLDFKVGAIAANTQRIIETAQKTQADLIVFPELCLSGYPPEDLLFRSDFYTRIHKALEALKDCSKNVPALIVGYPEQIDGKIYNQAGVIANGEIIATYAKQQLPNYSVFDEKRYFTAGDHARLFTYKDVSIALLICEDLWQGETVAACKQLGADLIISLNASPFAFEQQELRESLIKQHSKASKIAIVYANTVGAQDELVFDGGSFVSNAEGMIAQQAKFFSEQILLCEFDRNSCSFAEAAIAPSLTRVEKMYQALVLGLKDYVHKNNFKSVILGLSGGIDSALTLAIAVDALGADHVTAILMPSRFTANISYEDAITEIEALQIDHQIISIEESYQSFLNTLKNTFANTTIDLTEQNIQARCRAVILMALSNKFGSLVLTTSNKSEIAVGYSTLYGDMAGGFCVLKDVLKTDVYRLAQFRNSFSQVIPLRVIERAPSAELAENQLDQDSLPPYEVLDEIIKLSVEQNQDAEAIVARGFTSDIVYEVLKKIKQNEHKRRQAPLGVRLNPGAFGRDRRYPITSGYEL